MKKYTLPIIITSAIIGIASAIFLITKNLFKSKKQPEYFTFQTENSIKKNFESDEAIDSEMVNQYCPKFKKTKSKKMICTKSIKTQKYLSVVKGIHKANVAIINKYFKTAKSLNNDINQYVDLQTENAPFQNIFVDEYYEIINPLTDKFHSVFLDIKNTQILCSKIYRELAQNQEITARIFKKIYNSQELNKSNFNYVKRTIELIDLYEKVKNIQSCNNYSDHQGVIITEYENENNLKSYMIKYRIPL